MAGDSVWALYNTAAAAEYKSVSFIWFLKKSSSDIMGFFVFTICEILINLLIKFSLSDEIMIKKSRFLMWNFLFLRAKLSDFGSYLAVIFK